MGLNANSIVTVQKVKHNVSAIEKPRHTEILVMKAAAGSDGRDGRNGYDGKDGRNGKDGKDGRDGINGLNGRDGGAYVPNIDGGKLSWTYVNEVNPAESPSPTNIFANIDSITNAEIYNIVNNGDI